jgi:glycosyltransferase involved in cell wall biosynthesis
MNSWPALLYGLLLTLTGLTIYVGAAAIDIVCFPWFPAQTAAAMRPVYAISGALVWIGIALACFDLFVLLPRKRRPNQVTVNPLRDPQVTVVLTAYNDEQSIGLSVDDFLSHSLVRRVIVVDNNSRDRTAEVAKAHGAIVHHESQPGYGRCVFRALTEGLACTDTDVTLLCEGDMTFRAYDIDKFLAYIAHADIVNGTRIVEQLRSRDTQLTTFMYYGNFFVGKLLEARHVGKGTFTDVGTTYKLCRNDALRRLMPNLNPAINLEFNAHFLDTALATGLRLLECPITFHNRVGVSKGGNTNDWRAFSVGMRMIRGIVFGWEPQAQ